MVDDKDPVLNLKHFRLSLHDILKKCENLVKYLRKIMSYQESYVTTKVSWLFIKELEFSLPPEDELQLQKFLENVKLYLPEDSSPRRIQSLNELDIYKNSQILLNYLKNYMSPQETYVITKATWLLLKKSDYALSPEEELQFEEILQKITKMLQTLKIKNQSS